MTTASTTETECPKCGKKGKTVKALTLRAILTNEVAAQLADAEYRFCDAKNCDIVYPAPVEPVLQALEGEPAIEERLLKAARHRPGNDPSCAKCCRS